MLEKLNPTGTLAWQKLRDHFFDLQFVKMQDLFAEDSERAQKFHVQWNDFILDFSKNRITTETIELLTDLATEVSLKEAIEAMFSGVNINETENRAVLHTALRNRNLQNEVSETLNKIEVFSNQIINGDLVGTTGKPFTDVINLGIGGSDLGPKMVVEALVDYKNHLNSHFISNIDNDTISRKLKSLNPETTLVILVSK